MTTLLYILTILASGYALLCITDFRRRKNIHKDREEESICTFARSLPYREIDLKIVRSTIDVLGAWWTVGGDQIPFRKTDRIADFGCVGDDLDDCVIEVCQKSGRSIDFEGNPMARKVKTVEDFIAFVDLQPKASNK